MKENKTKVLPYGDALNDGKVQISFTLPLKNDELGGAAALAVAKEMGLVNSELVHSQSLSENYTFYIIYGVYTKTIDVSKLKIDKIDSPAMTMNQIEDVIEKYIKRDLVVIGASTGSDAHTVGIDAIMNMKGLAGHFGLERYKGIVSYNLGSQVENEEFIKKAKELKADVLLVSQTVTQKDVHVKNLTNLVELLESEKMRDEVILIVGGARISNELAKELGYDAGFGLGKYAEDVASFFVNEYIKRKGQKINEI